MEEVLGRGHVGEGREGSLTEGRPSVSLELCFPQAGSTFSSPSTLNLLGCLRTNLTFRPAVGVAPSLG